MSGKDHDPVCQIDRFSDIVGHKENCLPGRFPDALQILVQPITGLRVESGKRLVHEQHFRLHGKGTGNGHPLLHAPRQLMRKRLLKVREVDDTEERPGEFPSLFFGQPLSPETKLHVLDHSQPGKESGFLKDHEPVWTRFDNGSSAEEHLSSRG